MKKIEQGVKEIIQTLTSDTDDITKKAARNAIVQVAWKNAVEEVYKDPDAIAFILDHINAVYILAADAIIYGDRDGVSRKKTTPIEKKGSAVKKKGAQLVVYVDDSLVRSDLDARQEFLKMKLREQGEYVETFKILPSRFDMKTRFPYRKKEEQPSDYLEQTETAPFDSKLIKEVHTHAESVENDAVRAALIRAINADTNRKSPNNTK